MIILRGLDAATRYVGQSVSPRQLTVGEKLLLSEKMVNIHCSYSTYTDTTRHPIRVTFRNHFHFICQGTDDYFFNIFSIELIENRSFRISYTTVILHFKHLFSYSSRETPWPIAAYS